MRVGVLDSAAVATLVIVAVLPSPARPIKPQYTKAQAVLAPQIVEAQADVARHPDDGAAQARLISLLVAARQTDWAIRAGALAATVASPDRWRVLVATSAAHADRLEINLAFEWARKAVAACVEDGADCPDWERGRLEIYVKALQAAHESGVDPKLNPKGLTDAVERAVPLIRSGKRKSP